MGLFYKIRYENKNNKKYLVLKPIPQRIIVNYISMVIMAISVYMKSILGDNYLTFVFTIMGLFALGVTLQLKDQFPALIARVRKKEVIVKGGTTMFNFKNPREIWIEQ